MSGDYPQSWGSAGWTNSACASDSRWFGYGTRLQLHVVVIYHVTISSSSWTWVVEEMLAFGNRLRSTHCREFNYLKLCRPAYFVRTTQLQTYDFYVICMWTCVVIRIMYMKIETVIFFIMLKKCKNWIKLVGQDVSIKKEEMHFYHWKSALGVRTRRTTRPATRSGWTGMSGSTAAAAWRRIYGGAAVPGHLRHSAPPRLRRWRRRRARGPPRRLRQPARSACPLYPPPAPRCHCPSTWWRRCF